METKRLVGACLIVLFVLGPHIAVAQTTDNPSKVLKSQASGAFVSTNFDFDHPDLSTPANYFDGEGIGNKGKFTVQGTNEFASDKKTCTVPGGSTGAGTEFTLVGSIGISRFSATSDLLFSKATSATVCEDFSTFPTPPFPFVETETGIVTGGTGSFSGVTGTYTAMVRGAQLSLDATGVRGVGWFKNNVVTTLNGH
jgi:hypothetical protein